MVRPLMVPRYKALSTRRREVSVVFVSGCAVMFHGVAGLSTLYGCGVRSGLWLRSCAMSLVVSFRLVVPKRRDGGLASCMHTDGVGRDSKVARGIGGDAAAASFQRVLVVTLLFVVRMGPHHGPRVHIRMGKMSMYGRDYDTPRVMLVSDRGRVG